jgi:polar amino acid transport system substrate-binding protein
LIKAGLNVDYAVTDEQSFKKLFLNRVQIVPSDELVGWALVRRFFPKYLNEVAVIKKPMNQDQLRLMISKKYPNADALMKKFNSSLAKIRKAGVIRKILKKYGVKE